MAVNAPEEEQTNLVAALRDKVSTFLFIYCKASADCAADPPHCTSGTEPINTAGTSRVEVEKRQYVPERSRENFIKWRSFQLTWL